MDKEKLRLLISSMNDCLDILEKQKSIHVPNDELEHTIMILKRSDITLQQAQNDYEKIVDLIQNIRSKIDYEIDLLDEVLTKKIMKTINE